MKHLFKFNESKRILIATSGTDEDIKQFFYDWTDEDPNCLKIEDCLIYDNKPMENGHTRGIIGRQVVKNTTYIKDSSKYKKAKLIKFTVAKLDGISIDGASCLTDIKVLQDAISLIDRFYKFLGEEINYTINTEKYSDELVISFIISGSEFKEDESDASKIDQYLNEFKEILSGKGFLYKRIKINGNWLDVTTPKGKGSRANFGDQSADLTSYIKRIISGQVNLQNTTNERLIFLIKWLDKLRQDGFKLEISGGDNQAVFKIKRL